MDRVERKELKHDKFVEQVGHTVEYASEHRSQLIRYGGIVLALLIVAAGVYFYRDYQHTQRQMALRHALQVNDAQVGEQKTDFFVTFATAEEKAKATEKAWKELAAKYPGSDEGYIARYYTGTTYLDRGDTGEAEKAFKEVAAGASKPYASQARFALAQLYGATNRPADAEKLLRELLNDPTMMVSKDQATIELARVIAKSKPEEARKLLEPLRSAPGAASRAAITAMGEVGTPR